MFKNIEELIKSFNTNPILFMGSGITRRYYNLPSWQGLLKEFITRITNDEFAYASYFSKAERETRSESQVYQKIADFIEIDFNKKWYEDKSFRKIVDEKFIEKVKEGCSPFKAEIAQFIKDNSILSEKYQQEIEKLKEIANRSISGIITTNYDNFFEDNLDGFKQYIGQDELLFSNIQAIGEIYKIHGSIERPESIIINSRDYAIFEEKSKYLAAKLLTLFIEYPIIFMGYSISDPNIQNILNNIIKCLPRDKVEVLKNRFVFVEYVEDDIIELGTHTLKVDDKLLEMTKIQINDFNLLYSQIGKRKTKIPVGVLRNLKEQLCEYVITSEPTTKLRVANIDDKRIDNEDFAISIGKMSDICSLKGLNGLTANEWYRNIIKEDLPFDNELLLEYAPTLISQNSGYIPLNKYLSKDKENKFKDLRENALKNDWEKIISDSIKNKRKCVENFNSVLDIWETMKNDETKATYLIAHLKKEKIDVDELKTVLLEIFNKDINILDGENKTLRTNIRRLIKIYDYLKYSDKVKELFN